MTPPRWSDDAERASWALIRAVIDGDEVARQAIMSTAPLSELADALSVIPAGGMRRYTLSEGCAPDLVDEVISAKIGAGLAP
jgi:hypothetical protein